MSLRGQARRDVTVSPYKSPTVLDSEEASSSPPQSFRSISSGISTLFVARIDQSAAQSTSSKQPIVRVRKSGHIKRWVEEQRRLATGADTVGNTDSINNNPSVGTPCNPYLAYPHITWSTPIERPDDGASLADYVIVEDDENGGEWLPPPSQASFLSSQESPGPSTSIRSSVKRGLRFSLPFSRRTETLLDDDTPETPRASAMNMHRREPIPVQFRIDEKSLIGENHSPNTTLSGSPSNNKTIHFGTPSPSSFKYRNGSTTPRASVDTTSSERTDNSFTPSRLNRINSRTSNGFTASSIGGSSYSVPLSRGTPHRSIFSAASLNSPSTTFSASQSSHSITKYQVNDVKHFSKPSLLTKKSSQLLRDFAQLSSSITSPKKKKLVVSGIAQNDYRALVGLRQWCESFGEVRQMTWGPNGDVHVDFKRSDVADSVCRIRAQVTIPGVGSVALSWFTGRKP